MVGAGVFALQMALTNAGYGASDIINIDTTPPIVTVSQGSVDDSFKATDDDSATTTWDYVLIDNNTCDSTTDFNNPISYTEGDDVSYTAADNGKRYCFRSTEYFVNIGFISGFGASDVINPDTTPPTVTVSRGSADDTFQANDNDSSPTTWAYVLITNNTCNSTTSFSGSSSYNEGDDVVHNASNNGKPGLLQINWRFRQRWLWSICHHLHR